VSRKEKVLWNEVSAVLGDRPGWALEPAVTPGQPPSWCFGTGGVSELAVSILHGSVSIYLVDRDQEIDVVDAQAMTAWLDANESFFANRSTMTADDFVAGVQRLVAEWRADP
jgi:hypothetical protein